MSKITKTLFGGTDDSAQMEQLAQNQRNEGYIRQMAQQARGDLQRGYSSAGQTLGQNYQGALDVMGQAIPQQLSTFQQGNLAAQNYLLGGMPMYEAALRGRPIDYGAQQAFAVQYDPSFAQQRLGQANQMQESGMGRLGNALSGFAAGYGGYAPQYMAAQNMRQQNKMSQYDMPEGADLRGIDVQMGRRIA